MGDYSDKIIAIKNELQNYIGESKCEYTKSERQKIAVEKLIELKDENFERLCNDLINEIRRRTGKEYDKHNSMCQKFDKLSDEKLQNLVIDSLMVIYYKNDEFSLGDLPATLNNANKLISDLRKDNEKNVLLNGLRSIPFYDKLNGFLKYLATKDVDQEVLSFMKDAVNQRIEQNCDEFIDAVTQPKIFATKLASSTVYKEIIQPNHLLDQKFQSLKNEIIETSSNRDQDILIRSKMIKNSTNQLISMYITYMPVSVKEIECFSDELSRLALVLDKIYFEMTGEEKVNLNEISSELTHITSGLLEKAEMRCVPIDLSTKLKSTIKLVSLIENAPNRKQAFMIILSLAKEIRAIFSQIEI